MSAEFLFSVYMNRKDPSDGTKNFDTEELAKTNADLRAEIIRYKQTEQALRRSEAYLAEAERLSHTGSWAYDVATGVPVYWSLERCRVSKFDPAKGHPTLEEYRQLHAAEDWEKLMEAFKYAIRNKIDFETDARELLMDGTVKHLHIVGHPVLNAEGEVVELVGSTIDMTERKRTEEALHKAQAHLNHMTHLTMMGELAASIAHEVNQPLAAVVTNGNACLRWLDRDPPDFSEAKEAVRRIVRDGIRGADVIARIRALIRKEPQATTSLDINDVIREIVALAQTHFRGVKLQLELADKLAHVQVDRIQLQQVILNLITNAVDAMKSVADRPKILRVQTRMKSPRVISVSVEDSGVGINPETTESIFEPFYTTKPSGLGMGLSISRSIVDAHGGRLWAEPGKEVGAVFQFTLPADGPTS
ncbi:MAG TPA: ATP-binding protein [Candidatus Acidoferrum sp.]|nr:ATP-binding protein [Candidatus Acidoferrum sp.]HWY75924.1 ATP-binding protein [Verrucomicrobiae bacterium]